MSRRGLVLSLVVLALTAAASTLVQALPGGADSKFPAPPEALGDWRGADEPVDPRAREVLGTSEMLLRRYTRPGAEVVLALAASPVDRRVAHPPEVCMRAAGYEILSRDAVAVPGVEGGAVHLDAVHRGRREQVLYYYLAGGRATGAYLGSQLDAAVGRLTGRGGGVALVRLSAVGDPAAVLPRLTTFAGLLLVDAKRTPSR